MNMRRTPIVTLSLFVVLVASPASSLLAQRGRPGPPDIDVGEAGIFVPPAQALQNIVGLSDEQIDQLEALKADLMASLEPLVEESRVLQEDIRAALDSASPSAVEVGQLVISSHMVRRDIREIRSLFRSEFENILTPDQLERLEDFKEDQLTRGRRRPTSPGRERDGEI